MERYKKCICKLSFIKSILYLLIILNIFGYSFAEVNMTNNFKEVANPYDNTRYSYGKVHPFNAIVKDNSYVAYLPPGCKSFSLQLGFSSNNGIQKRTVGRMGDNAPGSFGDKNFDGTPSFNAYRNGDIRNGTTDTTLYNRGASDSGPITEGEWVRFMTDQGSLIDGVKFTFTVDDTIYKNWYDQMTNDDCWDASGNPKEDCDGSGGGDPPPDGFTFTGHVVAVFPGISQISSINLPTMKISLENTSTSRTLETTTNSSGVFSFDSDNYDFDDGTYTLRIEPPNSIWAEYFPPVDYDGYFNISSQTTGTIGPDSDVIVPINAGGACVPEDPVITGTVQGAIEGQGLMNLQGIEVYLKDADGNINNSAISSHTGDFSFDVVPGKYTVEFIDPNGTFTQPSFSVTVEEDTALPPLSPTLRLLVPQDCIGYTPSHSLEKALENLEVISNKK